MCFLLIGMTSYCKSLEDASKYRSMLVLSLIYFRQLLSNHSFLRERRVLRSISSILLWCSPSLVNFVLLEISIVVMLLILALSTSKLVF